MIKHVFGPVVSRRLGISLGVDIIPYKTCALDCLYCECGKTTDITIERKRFVDPQIIMREIEEAVTREAHIDYITFSGSGEPTLNKDIGVIIAGIKKFTTIPVAIITNGVLLYMEDVRQDISNADLALPSLDAATQAAFSAINQPHNDLKIETVIDGLTRFRKIFKGEIWLEVFISKGINDSDEELDAIYNAIQRIKPGKVQLNSLDRPPAYDDVYPADMKTLERIMERWRDLPVEIIKRVHERNEITSFSHNLEHNILNTIHRRPMTVKDLEILTGKNKMELYRYIDILEKEKKISHKIVEDKIFYTPVSTLKPDI